MTSTKSPVDLPAVEDDKQTPEKSFIEMNMVKSISFFLIFFQTEEGILKMQKGYNLSNNPFSMVTFWSATRLVRGGKNTFNSFFIFKSCKNSSRS